MVGAKGMGNGGDQGVGCGRVRGSGSQGSMG